VLDATNDVEGDDSLGWFTVSSNGAEVVE